MYLKLFKNRYNMKNKKGVYVILVISILLIIANVWNAYPDDFDRGFYFRTIANIFLLISMVISVNHKKKEKTES